MREKSIFYKLGKWWAEEKIKACEEQGHHWKSYGTVRTCERCALTERPKQDHYFDIDGVEKSCNTKGKTSIENCANFGHVFPGYGISKCVVCGVEV